MNDCQCTGPGWCARHQVQKTAHWVHLCQTNQAYFDAWEAGTGPGQHVVVQPKSTDTMSVKPRKEGWGDAMTAALKKMGITEERYKEVKAMFGLPPTCGCPQRREWLNRIGRWWNGEDIDHAD